MRRLLLLAALALTATAHAQWTLQDSRTTADLRGIDNVGGGVAWASGTNGTVLRTEDAGFEWQVCTIPPGADHLDFRGIQAFDNNTAIVMSSGPGDQSRLYKTTDGCQSWHLLFTNPDKDGFWDALVATPTEGFIIGDPVENRFVVFQSSKTNLEQWTAFGQQSCPTCAVFDHRPFKSEAMFAASNSVLEGSPSSDIAFVTGGGTSLFHRSIWRANGIKGSPATISWTSSVPLAKGLTSGAFSFASKGKEALVTLHSHQVLIAVGGDYQQPTLSDGTAAWSKDGGLHWQSATTPPHGYRSSVAYDPTTHTWLTVGPNGTDISTDDGRSWRPLRPNLAFPDTQPDEDQHWNALSLPFVVGPHGRIATLRPSALAPAPQPPH
jgi:hypothetical protein